VLEDGQIRFCRVDADDIPVRDGDVIMGLRYEAGDPYHCLTFDAVPGPNRIAEQDIEPWAYFD
jgi:hypothetical protein